MTREDIIELFVRGAEIDELRRVFQYDRDTGVIRWSDEAPAGVQGDIAGCIDLTRYVVVQYMGQRIYGHRLAWALETGSWPEDEIDHINGVRALNRWTNLRSVAAAENQKNMKKAINNTSGVTGVSFCRRRQKWVASIGVGNDTVYLGAFSKKAAAVSLRKGAEKGFGFYENHGRDA